MPTPLPISSECNRDYTAARGWSAPRDPLVLDLDGDGIETVGINPAAPVLFDHDGDTLRTGTGWVGTDDGLLVLDINSNGVIDTGRELFGDNTRLGSAANAPNAANGYQALAQHDSNSDGQINSADAVYSQLRVWRDLNQDGTSQAGELQTLAQTGIASIGVAGTPTGTNLGNGNTQIYSGSFTRTNGSTGQSGVAELSGSLLLASNNFYSQFTVNPPLTAAALALPQMRGSGWVRDMREAASLGTPAAASLEQQLAAYSAATTRGEQRALLSGLAAAWGISSGGVQQVNGRPIGLWTLNVLPAGMTTTSPSGIKTITPEGGLFLSRLSILEAFNGDNFFDITLPDANGNVRVSSGGGGGGGVGSVAGGAIDVHLSQNQVDLINSSWTSLTNSLYSSLLLQTRLRPYLDSIALVINANGVQFDTAGLAALLASVKTTNLERALTDLVELNQYAGSTLRAVDFAGLVLLKDWIDALPANSPLRATLVELNVWGASASTGTASNDIWYGDAANNTFTAGAGDDSLVGYGGDDVLYGGDGADSLDGGVGADLLMGGAGNDVLIGGAGNDTLAGGVYDSWNGNYNGAGNDTYIFGAGDGQDNIHDNDTTANNLDQIIFRAGVLPANVTVIRSGDNLILRIDGSTDQITVSGYFGVDGTNGAQIEQIRFTDAPTTVWSVSTIKAMALIGGAGADTLVGYASADTLSGGDGNDNISGLDGNDTVNGGNGSDYLYGNNGDDTLNGDADGDLLMGGAGNDTLNGGAGNDTLAGGVYDSWNGNYQGAGNDAYLFGVGDGQDSIYDNDTTAGNLDKIVFKAGVLPANVTVVRSGDSLVLRINGTTDQITVNNYFGGDGTNGWQIEQIRFTDGTYWDYVTVQGMLASNLVGGTAAAETLTGAALDDQLLGLGGNDTLEAGAGNDWLDGGLGNDTLRGGAGSDVYLVDSAADIVIELANEGVDTVRSAVAWTLGAHVENLFLTGTAAVNGTGNTADNRLVGNSAANTLNGAEGADFMQGGLGNDTYQVDNLNDVVWEDAGEGTDTVRASLHWTLGANLENLTLLGTTAIDGTGNALNNTITGNAGANILTGGAGNETLNAAAGNDTLAGGLGNDKLTGGAGADTYLFGRGEGIDTVVENDATAGVNDRLLFGANVTTDQLWFVQNGNNLEVSIVGSLDKVVLSNWYLGTAYHVEQFQLSDGQILTDTKVQNLVQAMAAFAPPAQGTSNWSATYQASLQPVLAANWV